MKNIWCKYWAIILLTAVTLVGGYVWRAQCAAYDTGAEFNHMLPAPGEYWQWSIVADCSQVCDRWMQSVYLDNARLAQLFVIAAVSVFPQWLLAIINAVVFVSVPLMILLLVGGRNALQRPLLATFVFFSIIWFFPSYAQMVNAAYFVNYMLPMPLFMVSLLASRKWEINLKWRIIAIIAMIICALWHEMYGLLLCVYFGVYAITSKNREKHLWLLTVISGLCTGVLVFGAPGMLNRLFNTYNDYIYSSGISLSLGTIITLWTLWSYIILFLCALLLPQWRHIMDIRLCSALTCCIIAGMALCVFSGIYGRMLWPIIFLSIIGIVALVVNIHLSLPKILTWSVCILYALCSFSFFIYIAHWQHKMTQQQAYVCNAIYSAEDTHIVFADYTDVRDIPYLTLGAIDGNFNNSLDYIWARQNVGYHSQFVYLPDSMKGKLYKEWPLVPGSHKMRGTHDEWVMNECHDSLKAVLYFGESRTAQSPLNRIIRRANYGPSPTILMAYLACDSIGSYPAGDPNSEVLYRYRPLGLGVSMINVKIDSIKIVNFDICEP